MSILGSDCLVSLFLIFCDFLFRFLVARGLVSVMCMIVSAGFLLAIYEIDEIPNGAKIVR